jgi:hypothetical protein
MGCQLNSLNKQKKDVEISQASPSVSPIIFRENNHTKSFEN